jgi:hypothetical protein
VIPLVEPIAIGVRGAYGTDTKWVWLGDFLKCYIIVPGTDVENSRIRLVFLRPEGPKIIALNLTWESLKAEIQ